MEECLKNNKKVTKSHNTTNDNIANNMACTKPSCFYCILEESAISGSSARISNSFKQMILMEDDELIHVLNSLWYIAMTQPDDSKLPSLGIFECMAGLINKGLKDRIWLHRSQNMYVPYYAAHIIGSYTMNKVELAEKAVESGVILPLMELLSGKMSWIEQRVAVRALGHLASYETTFEAVARHEDEVVTLAMKLASECLELVYFTFVGVKDKANKRLKYQCDLLTGGIGGIEMENRKAEEWASQLQCWSLHLLNCFAIKERSISRICRPDFLNCLCEIWGGLTTNHASSSSPGGVGLIRILCYKKIGRRSIAGSEKVIENLCNISRSSEDWQYMGIDCLLLLLKDRETRYRVLDIAASYLIDLVELKTLRGKSNVGDTIAQTLLADFNQRKQKILKNKKVHGVLEEIWGLKVESRKTERIMPEEKVQERMFRVNFLKQQGNRCFWSGNIEDAKSKYTEALKLCPLKCRKERIVLYSNRGQCQLLIGDPDSAISDTTRALSLSRPPNSHPKSLWRRSQAYDMKGLAKESLMDCLMFVHGCIKSEPKTHHHVKIPYYAVQMISKQMGLTSTFAAAARFKALSINNHSGQVKESHNDDGESMNNNNNEEPPKDEMLRMAFENKGFISSLSTILEDPGIGKGGNNNNNNNNNRRKLQGAGGRKKAASVPSI